MLEPCLVLTGSLWAPGLELLGQEKAGIPMCPQPSQEPEGSASRTPTRLPAREGGEAGMGLGDDLVWPQDPSVHQGSHFWLTQNNLALSQAFSHLGAALG